MKKAQMLKADKVSQHSTMRYRFLSAQTSQVTTGERWWTHGKVKTALLNLLNHRPLLQG